MIARNRKSVNLTSPSRLPGAPVALLRKERIGIARCNASQARRITSASFWRERHSTRVPSKRQPVVLTFSSSNWARSASWPASLDAEGSWKTAAAPSSGNAELAYVEGPSRRSSCARHSPARKNQHTPVWPAGTKRVAGKHKLYRHMNRTACYAEPFSSLLQLAIHISIKRHALP
jgi:hypothetical protein